MSEEFELIKRILAKQHPRLKQRYGISELAIFGSFAREEESAQSDVDLFVAFERPIGLFRFVELETELSTLLNRRVDLVTKKALKPALRDEILQDLVYV